MCRLHHDDLCGCSSKFELVAEQVWIRWMCWRWVSLLHLCTRGEKVGEEQQPVIYSLEALQRRLCVSVSGAVLTLMVSTACYDRTISARHLINYYSYFHKRAPPEVLPQQAMWDL